MIYQVFINNQLFDEGTRAYVDAQIKAYKVNAAEWDDYIEVKVKHSYQSVVA